MAKRKPKPVRPITLADIASEARPSAYRSSIKREGRGAPAIYRSISGVRISRKLLEEWICFAVWFYLLLGVSERGQYGENVFDKVADLIGQRQPDDPCLPSASKWKVLVAGLPGHRQPRPQAATLAGRMVASPSLKASGVRRIWDRNWRRYARALVDAHDFIHQYGEPAPFDQLPRPTRLKIMTADLLIKHTSPVRFPEL